MRRRRFAVGGASGPGLACLLIGLSALLSGAISRVHAAAPANDNCSNPQVIPGNGLFPYLTTVVDITDATLNAGDPIPSNPFLVTRVAKSVWYKFTPTGNGIYTITTCSDAGTATTVVDTIMGLYTSPGGCNGPFTQVGEELGDDDCGPNGTQASITQTLSADTTYYIVVWKFCDNCTDDGLNNLQLMITGLVAPPNDLCSAAVNLALNLPRDDGTTVGANDQYRLEGTNGFNGLDQVPSPARGREVVYTFAAPTAGDYSFKALKYDENQDLVLYLLGSCPSGATPITISNCLAAANRSRVNSAEEIACFTMTAGQRVYVVVDDHNAGNPGTPFTIEVTRCVREREPNNSPAEASPLACGIEGSISPLSDADFFALGSFPAGYRAFALVDGEAAKFPDLDLRVTTTTDTLEYDNDNNDVAFGESAPNIAGTPLIGGPAFLLVNYNSGVRETEPYRLYAVVQPPLSEAVTETEPNDDKDTAIFDDRNYFSGTLSGGPLASTDVDVYGFSAAEGDLIFLSLDADPQRTNSPINARLELLDAAFNPVASVNDTASASSTNGPIGFFPSSPAEGLVYRSAIEGTFFARVSISPFAAGNAAWGDYLLSISKNCLVGGLGQNHAPTFPNLSVGPPVTVGVPVNLTATIWEPDIGDNLRLEVRWGDGTTNLVDYPAPGMVDVSVPHTYAVVNANYTVNVTVRDRLGATATATRQVHVNPKPQPARLRSLTRLPNGHISIQLEGTPNALYRIERCDTFALDWSEVGTSTANSSGQLSIEDSNPSNTSRFYRGIGVQ